VFGQSSCLRTASRMRRSRGRWECAALAAGVGARWCFGPAATGRHRAPAQAGRHPGRDGPDRVGARCPGPRFRGRPVDPGTSRCGRHPDNGSGAVEGVGTAAADQPARMEPAAARAAGGRAGRAGDRPLDRARVAAHQKGAVNTRAWNVFPDESGGSLLPRIRRTYSPRGRTPLLRHRLNRKRASMAGALGYHSADPGRGARPCFHLKPAQLRHRRPHRGPGTAEGVLPRRAGGPGPGRPVGPLEPGAAGLGGLSACRVGQAQPQTRPDGGGIEVVLAARADGHGSDAVAHPRGAGRPFKGDARDAAPLV
jgi:hypothetical protein